MSLGHWRFKMDKDVKQPEEKQPEEEVDKELEELLSQM